MIQPRYYRPHELADALGVSARTVHRWINKGLVQTVRAGWQVRIAQEEYDRVMRNGINCVPKKSMQTSPMTR